MTCGGSDRLHNSNSSNFLSLCALLSMNKRVLVCMCSKIKVGGSSFCKHNSVTCKMMPKINKIPKPCYVVIGEPFILGIIFETDCIF